MLPEDEPQQRIARFAKALAGRFAGRYPTTALRGGLSNAQALGIRDIVEELVAVLGAHPQLDLKHSNIDGYISKNHIEISSGALVELKTAQRLLRVSPHYTSVEALKTHGFESAQSMYFAGREPFLAQMSEPLGSAARARMAYARAHMTYATALATFARFNLSLNGTRVAAMESGGADLGLLENLPDLQALFGPLDYFECKDCQSVYSPAAYLVDLLQYLKLFKVTPLSGAPAAITSLTNARDALLFRRPEIQNIALDCPNTDVTLPYIDLVNEILEAFIAPPAQPPTPPVIIETTGTSPERQALPQQILQAAYAATNAAVYPFALPFDLAFAQTTAYLNAMGTSRTAIMALFAAAPGGPGAAAIACATLGLNAAMQAVITSHDAHQPWERWGFTTQTPTQVINPKTRTRFDPTDWVAALNVVPVLLQRGGMSFRQLLQLLEVSWVTHQGVSLQLGVSNGIVSADTDLMTFTGLTGDVLDRAQRLLRLAAVTGLRMWELDWALGSGSLDDPFLAFLADARAVTKRLSLPLGEVLAFWRAIEIRDVTNHLGDEDQFQPSTYSAVFANPTMLAAWASVFPPVASQAPGTFALNGNPIIPPQPVPTPAESANLNATTAALGISGDDVASILAATTPPTSNTLTLDTVTVLLRYARLASALSLSVPDLILWIELTGAAPFGATPADTLEFLRRFDVLRATRLGVHDLDYLLRNQSASQSAVAFTPEQSTILLQGIRDAIAKLTLAQHGDPQTIATVVIAALATATGVTANVITPVLGKTGILPLPAPTIAQLRQNPIVDPTQFPQLVGAFDTVARAAALYTAVRANETEFAFLVQNASTLGWLDPSALPSSPTSPYLTFEALLRALDARTTGRRRGLRSCSPCSRSGSYRVSCRPTSRPRSRDPDRFRRLPTRSARASPM